MNTNYEISLGTLAIVPNEENNSLVFEDNNRYIVEQTPLEIMEDSCIYFGSTYKGRQESARAILGVDYKIPILVEASNSLIVFPTMSPYASECCWISLNRVKSLTSVDKNNTIVNFDNGSKVLIHSSYRSLENQILRATKLSYILNNRYSNSFDKNPIKDEEDINEEEIDTENN